MLFVSSLIALVLAAAPAYSQAVQYTAGHNLTGIAGTWSSGSQAVLTGNGFADPATESFTYPKTTGVSYSFTNEGLGGFYEISRYRFVSNGSEPTCITGVIGWVHGTYTLNSNGSITMTPFGDGYQQIQDPCAATSNFIQNYNETEYYESWQIFQDPVTGFKLHLFAFDGSPVAPQFQISATPNMLPTQLLRNVTASVSTTTTNGYTTQNEVVLKKRSAAKRNWEFSVAGAGIVLGLAVLSVAM